jgi:hypothetical protein
MAAFTSVTDGNWNDGATWGNTSPGTKGTHWPGLAGDTATVSSGDTVTYNVDEDNELGQVTIAGTLNFSTSMSTAMRFGNTSNGFLVQASGEVNIGTEASPLSSSYTAEITFNPTSSYQTHFSIDDDARLRFFGDPDLYGSKPTAYLQSAWTTGQTFTINGDYTSDWSSGLWIIVMRAGTSSIGVADAGDCYSIASVAANGGNTDITINETAPGLTYAAGADVFVISRNIQVSRYWTTSPRGYRGHTTTNSPGATFSGPAYGATTVKPSNLNYIQDVWFDGWNNPPRGGYCCTTINCVWTSCEGDLSIGYNINTPAKLENIFYLGNDGRVYLYSAIVDSLYSFGNGYALDSYDSTVYNARLGGSSYISYNMYNSFWHGWAYAYSSYGFYNIYGYDSYVSMEFGYDERGNQQYTGSIFYNAPTGHTSPHNGPVFTSCKFAPTITTMMGGYDGNAAVKQHAIFENSDYVEGDLYLTANHTTQTVVSADNTSGRPAQRDGGSSRLVRVEYIGSTNYDYEKVADRLHILDAQLTVESGVTKTYRYYVQSAFSRTLTAYEICLTARCIGDASSSTQSVTARSDSSDWTQYIEVTLTPQRTGPAELFILFTENPRVLSEYVYIDPNFEIR